MKNETILNGERMKKKGEVRTRWNWGKRQQKKTKKWTEPADNKILFDHGVEEGGRVCSLAMRTKEGKKSPRCGKAEGTRGGKCLWPLKNHIKLTRR